MKIKTKNFHFACFLTKAYTKILHREFKIYHDHDINKEYSPEEIINNWYYIIELK
jgi:hypothetical protein